MPKDAKSHVQDLDHQPWQWDKFLAFRWTFLIHWTYLSPTLKALTKTNVKICQKSHHWVSPLVRLLVARPSNHVQLPRNACIEQVCQRPSGKSRTSSTLPLAKCIILQSSCRPTACLSSTFPPKWGVSSRFVPSIYIHVHIYIYVCMYVRTYVRTYVCMYLHVSPSGQSFVELCQVSTNSAKHSKVL